MREDDVGDVVRGEAVGREALEEGAAAEDPGDGAHTGVDEHHVVAGAYEEAPELELHHAVGGEQRPVWLPLLVGGADERLGGTEVRGAVV